ncbi:transposase [Scytonema sp. NUACC26]|uniref:transposase n=1 Tax=Scytonema sp. NUACC26 TaxID=3140176 RepID=UPI0034DCB754
MSSKKAFKQDRRFLLVLANWGKSSVGWYFGFKLHLIINELGELLTFRITKRQC